MVMFKQLRLGFIPLLFIASLVITELANAAPIASIDRSVIAVDDTLTFSIRINKGNIIKGPDLDPLHIDFHVLGNSQSNRHMTRNGRSESWTEWTVSLMPRRKGRLTIPPISVNGETTQAISLYVQPSVPMSADNMQPVFVESEISSDSVYVQQQLIYTLRIYQAVQLDNMSIKEPEFDNAVVEKLGQNSFQRRLQNTPYTVHELSYAIFPQEVGQLTLPEMLFSANHRASRRSAFNLPGQGKPIRKKTQPHTITVKPPATAMKGNLWLPAESITLKESWSSSLDNIHVGDSITRTITLTAKGMIASQLPPFTFPSIAGAKMYPDQGSAENTTTDTGVIASRSDNAAIIPTREGSIQLEEIRVKWWDSKSHKMQEAVIPASTLTIKPALDQHSSDSTPLAIDHSKVATAAATTTPVDSDSGSSLFWICCSALLALGWAITALLWWRSNQRQASHAPVDNLSPATNLSEKKAFKALSAICLQNDIQQTRQAMINWGRSFWPEENIHSLDDIRLHCQHPALSSILQQLDGQLYGSDNSDSSWNGANLLAEVKLLREKYNKENSEPSAGLKPLYKN